MKKDIIIIIGAGVAGLVAARALGTRYQVVILEAANRIGGRICSLADDATGILVEGGAEFMHGPTKRTMALLDEAGIQYLPAYGKMLRKEQGRWTEQTYMIEGWDDLLHTLGTLEQDMTMYELVMQYYGGPKHETLRAHITAFVEGFDCADMERVSALSLYREWQEEGEQYRVAGSYGAMTDHLLRECTKGGCELHTGTLVKTIDWQAGNVRVQTADGRVFHGVKCIITVPVGVLQQVDSKASITITPLPAPYREAISQIGFGTALKIVMRFARPLWGKDTAFIFCDKPFPTWWTQVPNDAPILTCWVGGPNAAELSKLPDEELVDKAMATLAGVFDMKVSSLREELQAVKVFNWLKDPLVLGAYSYATLQSTAARKLLNTPIEDTIYFAGEGIYDGSFSGTVEGAIINAEEMVGKLLI